MKLISAWSAVVAFSTSASATYAGWYGARGVQVGNIFALEGGWLYTGTFSNGVWSGKVPVPTTNGLYRKIDLKQPFAAGVDPNQIFINQTETADGDAPNTINGVMFHNDISWYTFAGQTTGNRTANSNSSVVRGTLFGNDPKISTSQVRTQSDGDNGVWENIGSSAYASSGDPSQGFGWLFGGMAKADHSLIKYPLPTRPGPNDTLLASNVFYQADMKTSAIHITLNTRTSPSATARAAGGLVWLPFGQAGILVALGGSQYPADYYLNKPPVASTDNTFMKDLLVYDIATDKWFSQSTLENGPNPGQLASFCTAVVPSQDNHSQHIIVYGGWDGTGSHAAVDDVWILSVPAFQWTQVYQSTTASHARKGSVCFAPNPTTFISIGGSNAQTTLLDSGDSFIDIFNLTSLSWGSSYDPSSNSTFSPPQKLVSQLQWPNANGPGSLSAANINDQTLRSILSTNYPRAITPSYPYMFANVTANTPPHTSSAAAAPSKGKNLAVILPLAIIIPIVVIASLVGACLFYRRRKRGDQHTRNKNSEVGSWANKVGRDEKSNVDTDITAIGSPDEEYPPVIPGYARKDHDIHEFDAQNTPNGARSPGQTSTLYSQQPQPHYYEIMDHDRREPMALSAHPPNANAQQSEIRSELGSDKHASELPQASSRENLSVPSGGVVAGASQPSSISRKPVAERRESTPLPSPSTPSMGHARGTSDVSSTVLTASPNTEFRRSQHIDSLPDQPGLLGEGRLTPTTQGRASAYKEKFDDK